MSVDLSQNPFTTAFQVIHTAATVGGISNTTAVFAMRAAADATRRAYIERVWMEILWSSTAVADSIMGYYFARFRTATHSGGVALTPVPRKYGSGATPEVITDARWVAAGTALVDTSVVYEAPIGRLALPVNQAFGRAEREWDLRGGREIELAPGEGLAICISSPTAHIGAVLNAEVTFLES